MKPRRGRRFKAMQRRRRMAGELGHGDQGPHGVRGGFSRFAGRIKDAVRPASRPWHRVDYFSAWDHEDRPRLLHTIAKDLNLYRPGTRRLDPRRVARLDKQRIHGSNAFTAYELVLQYRLGGEMAPLVRRGEMTWAEFDREYDRFATETLPRIRRHVIPQVMEDLRRQAGLDLSRGGGE